MGINNSKMNLNNNLAGEEKLLLIGIGDNDSLSEQKAWIRQIVREDPNWELFLKLATKMQVAPLVYYNFKGRGLLNLLPSQARDSLRSLYYVALHRNLVVQKYASGILKDLSSVADMIVLKGLVLVENLYQDVGVRTFCDLDILVKESDLVQINSVLTDKWKMNCSMESHSERSYQASRSKETGARLPFMIDLTWRITSSKCFERATGWSSRGLWNDNYYAVICEQKVKILSPENTLLHLCYHLAFRHLFKVNNLCWYVDLAKLVSKGNLDWSKVVARAQSYGIGTVTRKALLYVKELLGVPVPDEVFSKLREKFPASFVAQLPAKETLPRNNLVQPTGFKYHLWQCFLLDEPRRIARMLSLQSRGH